MKVGIASDHAGLALKSDLVAYLKSKGIEVQDFGPSTLDSVDYPDFAAQVADSVADGEVPLGVLVCGTGIGMSIAANKHRKIRAAVCTSEFEARMARAHNDANVLCLGERVLGAGLAREILDVFLKEKFQGGRHQRRVDKINDAESDRK